MDIGKVHELKTATLRTLLAELRNHQTTVELKTGGEYSTGISTGIDVAITKLLKALGLPDDYEKTCDAQEMREASREF